MKKINIGLGILVTVFLLYSFIVVKPLDETKGILFQSISLEQAKVIAKEKNKLIFIDVYASWCGPCKAMARGPFMEKKVADIYNKKFINLKIDAEKDPDGALVSRTYAVRAYPTMVFITPEGKLVKKLQGYRTADDLLIEAEMRTGN